MYVSASPLPQAARQAAPVAHQRRLVKVTEIAINHSTRDLARASVGSVAVDGGPGGLPPVRRVKVAFGDSDDEEASAAAESALSLHEALESSLSAAERALLERVVHFLKAALLSSATCVASDLIVQLAIQKRKAIDTHRVMVMAIFGAMKGLFMTRYHQLAEQAIPGTKPLSVLQKLGIDCGVVSTLMNWSFIAYAELTLHGRSIADSLSTAVEQIGRVQQQGLKFWPLANSINYFIIPAELRVPYCCAAGMVWTVVMCMICDHKSNR